MTIISEIVLKEYTINGDPIEFEWPEYIPPFNLNLSPVVDKQLMEECDQKYLLLYKPQDIPKGKFYTYLCSAFLYNQCTDRSRMKWLLIFQFFMFIQDDDQECPEGEVGRNERRAKERFSPIVSLLDGIIFNPFQSINHIDLTQFDKCSRVLIQCIQQFCNSYSPNQRKRLAKSLKEFYVEMIEECQLYGGSKSMDDIKHRYQMMSANRGFSYTTHLIEYALGIEITDEQWADPLFNELVNVCGKSTIYWNEIVSFRKEIIECNGDLSKCSNMIAWFILKEKLSLQQSVDKVMEGIDECDKRAIDLGEDLTKAHPYSEDFLKMINQTKNLVSGMWMFAYANDRYFGDTKQIPPISGKFIFSKDRTIIIPKPDYNPDKYEYLAEFKKVK